MDEAALVRLAQRGGDADGEAQEASRFHRRADQALERLAAGILEQQRRSTAFAGKCERPCRPCGVEFVPQFIFMSEAIERRRWRALRGGQHGQHRVAAAISIRAPSAAEDAFAVLPRDSKITNPISVELKGWVQLPNSCSALRAILHDFAVERGPEQAQESLQPGAAAVDLPPAHNLCRPFGLPGPRSGCR